MNANSSEENANSSEENANSSEENANLIEENANSIKLYLSKIDDDGNIKATIINGDEVVISAISQLQNVFGQHSPLNAIKITSREDAHGREIGCHLVHMTANEFAYIGRLINNEQFELRQQINTDSDAPLLPEPLIRNQPSISEIYFTEARFRELTLENTENDLPSESPVNT
jgi:hypothetical protein